MVDKIGFLKIKIESIKKSLNEYNSNDKQTHISKGMANDFNDILDILVAEKPNIQYILPKKITTSRPYDIMQKADITYMDLHILYNQIIAIVSEIQSGE
tara:strand:- start:521 stop:817 length:297 start_codon:yes stop_codon:yes gene_type:complete